MKCPKCGRDGLTVEDFYRGGKNRRDGYCRECRKSMDHARFQRQKLKNTLRSGKRQHGYVITAEEYNDLLTSQKNTCLICGKEETVEQGGRIVRLSVDHSHTTNKVRALLCSRCNAVLGMANDDPKLLRRAAAYAQIFSSEHPDPHTVMLNIRDRNFK